MELTQEDIKKIEKVGQTKKGEIYHVLTKGGLNLIVQKSMGGEYSVLGQGAHRSFARNQAESIEKIEWNEGLWKTEDLQKAPTKYTNAQGQEATHYTPEEAKAMYQAEGRDALGNKIVESTPQKHYDLASHHSKMAGKSALEEKQLEATGAGMEQTHNARMSQLMHSDVALKHYQMSGLDYKKSNDEHKKHMTLHHELKDSTPPHNQYDLERAYNVANPHKPRISGLGSNWSE